MSENVISNHLVERNNSQSEAQAESEESITTKFGNTTTQVIQPKDQYRPRRASKT
jgi:hypothetical protein